MDFEKMKIENEILGKFLDKLLDSMPEEDPGIKTMKYSKKIRDVVMKLPNLAIEKYKANGDFEKVQRIDNFLEEMYKLAEEFMKQENIEGV